MVNSLNKLWAFWPRREIAILVGVMLIAAPMSGCGRKATEPSFDPATAALAKRNQVKSDLSRLETMISSLQNDPKKSAAEKASYLPPMQKRRDALVAELNSLHTALTAATAP